MYIYNLCIYIYLYNYLFICLYIWNNSAQYANKIRYSKDNLIEIIYITYMYI